MDGGFIAVICAATIVRTQSMSEAVKGVKIVIKFINKTESSLFLNFAGDKIETKCSTAALPLQIVPPTCCVQFSASQ